MNGDFQYLKSVIHHDDEAREDVVHRIKAA